MVESRAGTSQVGCLRFLVEHHHPWSQYFAKLFDFTRVLVYWRLDVARAIFASAWFVGRSAMEKTCDYQQNIQFRHF